ncbi:MAG: hypothetical protein ACREGI_00140 [Candidatus Levyibacteriota bacterium]
MEIFEKQLDQLKVPEVSVAAHKNLLKKKLLREFNITGEDFLKGGDHFMSQNFKQNFWKITIGTAFFVVAVVLATGFNPFKGNQVSAQDLAKKALTTVSQLPQTQQDELTLQKETLTKALQAKDLHIDSSSGKTQSGSHVTTLKFTDNDGHEESIEIDDKDLPVAQNSNPSGAPSESPAPSTVVSPTGSGSAVSPTAIPTHASVYVSGGDDSNEREGNKNTTNNTVQNNSGSNNSETEDR